MQGHGSHDTRTSQASWLNFRLFYANTTLDEIVHKHFDFKCKILTTWSKAIITAVFRVV